MSVRVSVEEQRLRDWIPPRIAGRLRQQDLGEIIVDSRLANTPRYYMGPTPPWIHMRIPPEILKSVLFIGYPYEDNGREGFKPIATGFVVSVPHGNTSYRYLVTTKHAIDSLGVKQKQIRFNRKSDGHAVVVNLNETPWFHPNESESPRDDDPVDVAVFRFRAKDAEIQPIPATMFLSDEAIQDYYVGSGDEVSITGLFTRMMGTERNFHIVRRGSVAMLPDEMIPAVDLGNRVRPMQGYLIEVRSSGGISGAPAFVRAPVGVDYTVNTQSGKKRVARAHFQGDYFFLGLCQGHWEISPDAINDVDLVTTDQPKETGIALASDKPGTETEGADQEARKESINVGIAIVVPAKRILEVLYQPTLMDERTKEQRSHEARGATTLDLG
jgi:hypothetical protein